MRNFTGWKPSEALWENEVNLNELSIDDVCKSVFFFFLSLTSSDSQLGVM